MKKILPSIAEIFSEEGIAIPVSSHSIEDRIRYARLMDVEKKFRKFVDDTLRKFAGNGPVSYTASIIPIRHQDIPHIQRRVDMMNMYQERADIFGKRKRLPAMVIGFYEPPYKRRKTE